MNAATATRKKGQITVADFLTHQIELSGKKQKEIAEEIGYEKPNIITMFKQGRTPLPINKVGPMARALGIDPVHLLRIKMMQDSPHTWEAVESIVGRQIISEGEHQILNIIRDTAQGFDVRPTTDEEKIELAALVEKWREKHEKLGITALRKDIEKES